jgi:4-hydroxybenzoate polyprenyltransferase
MGVIFSVRHPNAFMLPVGALFGLASFLLVAHVWTLNDWADAPSDKLDSNRTRELVASSSALLQLSIGLLLVSLCIFALLPSPVLVLAVAIAFLSFLYSFVSAKRVALLSSGLHFLGGVLHFLLGYAVFSTIDRRAILCAPFFALVFTAGHAIQEIRDSDADRNVGIRTNAVVFGKRRVFFAALTGFVITYGYLFYLALAGLVPRQFEWLSPVLAILHVLRSVRVFHTGLTYERINRFRTEYRVTFILIGAYLFGSLFFSDVKEAAQASPNPTESIERFSPGRETASSSTQPVDRICREPVLNTQCLKKAPTSPRWLL